MTDEETMALVAHRIKRAIGGIRRHELVRGLYSYMDGQTLTNALIALEVRGLIKLKVYKSGPHGGRPATEYRYTGPFDLDEVFPKIPDARRKPMQSRQTAMLERFETALIELERIVFDLRNKPA